MKLYERILCPIDGSDTAEHGLREAVRLAAATGATLRLFHVVELQPALFGFDGGIIVNDVLDALTKVGVGVIERAKRYASEQGVEASTATVQAIGQRASDAIIEAADDFKADLIVLGTHGRRGVDRLVIGSNAELVVRQAHCAVLLVRKPEA